MTTAPVIDLSAPRPAGPGRAPARQWLADLMMGARLAGAGGRDGLTRTAMTAIGVGLGVAMLLLAAAVPSTWANRNARIDQRQPEATSERGGPGTALITQAHTVYKGREIGGTLVQPEGPDAPVPPGLTRLPASGEAYVSPALRDLLASSDGALLRPRVPYKIVGTIGHAGLSGPAELTYYAGSDHVPLRFASNVSHVTSWGRQVYREPLDPVLALFVVVIFVVLLLPIGVFVASAVRFGGDQRDRRLAALRLIGADTGMARRIAAGEALAAALLGLLVGGVFFLLGRWLAQLITLEDISVFAEDIRPGWRAVALVALVVPALAVAVSLLALRGTVIEPLGVVRRARPVRGRLWWRLVPPIAGLALLYPLIGRFTIRGQAPASPYRIAAGVVLLLVGVALLLPWTVEATVARLGRGPVAWQLAVRRLQVAAASPGRVTNGIAVAVAGAIALQMLFLGLEPAYTRQTGADLTRADLVISPAGPQAEPTQRAITGIPGVTGVLAVQETVAGVAHAQTGTPLQIAACPDLRQLADVPSCADGDTFLVGTTTETGHSVNDAKVPPPGTWLTIAESGRPWQIPTGARHLRAARTGMGSNFSGVLATPSAMQDALSKQSSTTIYLRTSSSNPDTIELVRNAVAAEDPTIPVNSLTETKVTDRFASLRRGLFIGAVVTLVLIGLSLLVGVLEQLRDRRRLLAVLSAVGTRRSTLGWSVLWQTAVPVTLGLLLAVPSGIGLGGVLLAMVDAPLHVDGPAIAGMAAASGAVVLLVTAASLPVLWRIMGAGGLRSE